MNIRFRPVETKDLVCCAGAIRDSFAYTADEIKQLVKLWRETIARGQCSGAVIEDLQKERLMWCCFIVFVSDEFVKQLYGTPEPYIGKQILHSYQSGTSPLLTGDEITERNSAGGLNLLVINSGAADWVQTPELISLLGRTMVEFTNYHTSGYRLNEFILETYSPAGSAWAEGSGLRLRWDCSDKVPEDGVRYGQPQARLYGMNRDEALESLGTVTSAVFHYRMPRLGFSVTERTTLLYGLTDATYQGQADMLNVATVTIGKRWQSIFDKVLGSPLAGELFPEIPATTSGTDGAGKSAIERKSHRKGVILDYVRRHMEEIRPYREPLSEWGSDREYRSF